MRSITCTNKSGYSITFGEKAFTPFLLVTVDGIYNAENSVFLSDNTMTDGSTYLGSVAKYRNIVFQVIDNPKSDWRYNISKRDLLYTLFKRNEEGELVYTENGISRRINYHSEYIRRARKKARAFSISLICHDPFFKDMEATTVSMSEWIPAFEFIHEFKEDGEELGYKSNVKLVEIINDHAADEIGLTIIITSTGDLTNPAIAHVEKNESIMIGSELKPFNMLGGDVITITTGVNNKHVMLTRNGQTTEINQYLTETSEFIQLQSGINHIAYSASSGENYMSVDVKYTFEYEGG